MTDHRNGGDGFERWAATPSRAVFLLVHGLGAHTGRWDEAAAFFLKWGIASYAVELRDAGVPGAAGGEEDRLDRYYAKLLGLYAVIVQEHPGRKVFLVGESLGAAVSLVFAAAHPGLFSGLICLSPAFAPRRRMALPDQLRIAAALVFDRGKTFTLPFDSSMCTRDPVWRGRMDRDVREYRSVSARFIFEILRIQAAAAAVRKTLMTPVLFLVAGEDRIVNTAAAKRFFEDLSVTDKTLKEFPEMYHSLSIDLGREAVFEAMARWVDERLPPQAEDAGGAG